MRELGVRSDEVVIHLVDQETISRLHGDFFDDPSPTDCLSFPIDHPLEPCVGPSILGELFVCPEVATEYASAHQGDPLRETALYIIHGLLHLLGYDDQTEEERLKMRAQETYLLERYCVY
jgi:probable rRNA maturation factor